MHTNRLKVERFDGVRLARQAGADLYAVDRNGHTPLDLASEPHRNLLIALQQQLQQQQPAEPPAQPEPAPAPARPHKPCKRRGRHARA